MKNALLSLMLIIALSSCRQKTSPEPLKESPGLYSKNFQPAAFENDNRKENIASLAGKLHELIVAHAEERHIPGVAYGVVVDDELVLSSGTGLMNREKKLPARTSTAFRIASMSKSFTAMAIVKLRDEGRLRLSDPVVKYIPEIAGITYLTEDSPQISIENLLTMTAGFPEDNPWGDRQLDESDAMLTELMASGPSLSNPPSYTYEYSNTGYALLGAIIKRVSGRTYQDYIRDEIFKPLGMDQTYWEIDEVAEDQLAIGYRWEDEKWKLEPMLHDGSYGAMGGLITTIEDFSKYVSFHLSAWPPRSGVDKGPVKRSSLREMHTPQFSRLYAKAEDYNGDTCALINGYGYGLGIRQDCHGITWVSHGGALPGFGSNYVFFPEYGIGLMAFGNLTYTTPWPYDKIAQLLFEKGKLQPRSLPVSDILKERQAQVTELIQQWDTVQGNELLAENFYLDKSRGHRMADWASIWEQAGAIDSVSEVSPYNQLRGQYKIYTKNGIVRVYFTLSPEPDPKVQQLEKIFEAGD
ncbi:serine hydrolase domain-containing protein [Lentiprolixibacter aurantiacus]|uniref:Serine hydrolase n=1 Tax=Lentiprolixibacter aurantiacus TaxID=2993939 RepID=A0AAE3SND5_9FLAO|nr:serine hydrolase domain-containing protein [Lentiprolixibacter aurantiacus]MCX2719519.1 serine hydrolase [Lentiprolixibacter aurantiacus]